MFDDVYYRANSWKKPRRMVMKAEWLEKGSSLRNKIRLEKAQISRMRETLIKIAARVKVSTRRVMVELTSNCPFQAEIKLILQKLLTGRQLIFS